MPKVKKTMEIPVDLARLLVATPEDFKEPEKYEEVQAVAKALLNTLLVVNK
jgi:hypothetical protein